MTPMTEYNNTGQQQPVVGTLPDHVVRAYDATRSLQHQPFRAACYAPFTTLEFTVNGEVVACWRSAQYVLGRVGEETLDAIWNGPRIQALREHLGRYEFLECCRSCHWQIGTGDVESVQSRWYDFLDAEPAARWPRQFYFSLGNECNYACVMCNGEVSSTFRARIEGRPPKPVVYNDAFFEQLDEYLPHLQAASFFGGEPFLVPGNYRVWDRLIALQSQAHIHINTNGSTLNDRVRSYLDRLNIGTIAVSIDGATKETFESVRRFSQFEKVMEHLEYFATFCRERGKRLNVVACILRQNYHELPQIYRLAQRLGGFVTINLVTNPAMHSVYALPAADRLRIRNVLQEAYRSMAVELSPVNASSFRGLIATMGTSPAEAGGRLATASPHP